MIFFSKSAIPAIVVTAGVALFGTPAMAQFTATQNSNANDLLESLLGDTTGLSNFNISLTGDPAAFGLFNNDPFGLGSGVALSTGNVEDLPGENVADDTPFVSDSDLNTDLVGLDSITIDIAFDADATVETLFFQYVFGSEEFLEFGGSEFNDAFSLALNGTNLALLNDGNTVTINNLVPAPSGPFNPDFITNPAGPGTETRLDGFTTVLAFEGALLQDATNTLSINIQDVGDEFLDSAVFIQGGSLGTVNPNGPSVPEPASVLGLLGACAFASSTFKKKLAHPASRRQTGAS